MQKRAELINVFHLIIKALKQNDVNALNDILSEDYRGFGLQGTIEGREHVLQNFKPGGVRLSEYTVENLEYDLSGDIGIVSGRGYIAGSYGDVQFEHYVLFTDIFRIEDKKWKYYKSQVTEINSL